MNFQAATVLRSLSLAAVALGCATSVQATVLASDDFTNPSYITGTSWPADNIIGQDALGYGFTGKWSLDGIYQGITITSPGVLGRPHNNGNNAGALADFASPIVLSSGQLFVSYTIDSASALNGSRIDLNNGSSGSLRASIGTQNTLGGPFAIDTGAGIGGAIGLSTVATAGQHTIVGVLDYTNDKVALFVDPTAGSYYGANGANDATVTAAWTPGGPVTFTGLAIVDNYSDTPTWGNIVVATSATDVGISGGVPEPATWALMLLGVGAVGGMTRRRRSEAPALAA